MASHWGTMRTNHDKELRMSIRRDPITGRWNISGWPVGIALVVSLLFWLTGAVFWIGHLIMALWGFVS